jgi:hypothetical protein
MTKLERKLLKLIDLLNEHVQNVYANFEVSDALVAKIGGLVSRARCSA